MKNIFLGPLLHWVIVVVLVAMGYFGGIYRSHVIQFNPFLIALLLIVVVTLLIVLKTSRPDVQVTRDPITDETGDEANG